LCLLPLLRRRPRLPTSGLAGLTSRTTLRRTLAPIPDILGVIGLLFLVLALSRPQEVDRERRVEREGLDILLVLDTSGSMDAEDFELSGRSVNRLEAAKSVIAEFISGRPDDRVGLVVFGEEAFTQVPLTTDHRALPIFLKQVRLGMAGEGSTAIGDAIAVAARRLRELEAPSKILILLTDGRNNSGQLDPIQAAQAAAAAGVRIYTIGMGGDGGRRGLFGMLGGGGSDLDERTLKRIAEIAGGRYFRADDTKTLSEVYTTIDQLEKTTAEISEHTRAEERFMAPLVLGLSLLLLQQVLAETLLRRLP
jgi:Ca-activated chloride channel family protein